MKKYRVCIDYEIKVSDTTTIVVKKDDILEHNGMYGEIRGRSPQFYIRRGMIGQAVEKGILEPIPLDTPV